ncbi:MAG: cache domain-containing protein, partial [Clostridia bacterium]
MKIKSKKTIIFALVAVLIFALWGTIYARYITELLTTESRMHLSEVATQGAASVQRQVARDFDMLEILADGRISDPNVPLEEKLERIKLQAEKFNLFRIGIVDLDGNATTSDGYNFSVADRDFFKSAVKGEAYLSEPIIDKVDKVTPGIVYAVPVYHDNKVVSVLFSGYELSKLTERIDITFYHESGIAFIADSKSNILLHPTKERIGRNLIEVASVSNDASDVKLFKANLSKGERGVARFIMKEEERFFAYAPIEGANDWFLVTSLPSKSVFERSKMVILFTILLIVGVILFFALIFFYIAWSKRKSNEKIIKMAYFDKLTDSPNIERFKL